MIFSRRLASFLHQLLFTLIIFLLLSANAFAQSPTNDSNGKYTDLITKFRCETDHAQYGEYYDWGHWAGGNYCGAMRPAGYYVWHGGAWSVWRTEASADVKNASKQTTGTPDANGKYKYLVYTFPCPTDVQEFGEFHDAGRAEGGLYCGDLRPSGYYVWHEGHWTVWAALNE